MNVPKNSGTPPQRCVFSNNGVHYVVKNKRKLGAFINNMIFQYTGKSSQLHYVLVDDEFLHQINLDYLQHDTWTDIITFDLSAADSECIVGEIYISVDRVKENAHAFENPVAEEMLRVILHGALHLCGFKDKTKKQRAEMRDLESRWMSGYLTGRNENPV